MNRTSRETVGDETRMNAASLTAFGSPSACAVCLRCFVDNSQEHYAQLESDAIVSDCIPQQQKRGRRRWARVGHRGAVDVVYEERVFGRHHSSGRGPINDSVMSDRRWGHSP